MKEQEKEIERFYFEIPSIERKKDALEYINEFITFGSEINGVGGLHRSLDDYEGWLIKLEKDKNGVLGQLVPNQTYFLIRENDNRIVGMINIRLALTDALKKRGGHIGYSIRPTERQKGYNKINLYLGLLECQKNGIKEVLLDCKKENVASAKTMLALGAKLIKEFYDDEIYKTDLQKYCIDVDASINENEEKYNQYINKDKMNKETL